MCGNCNCKVLGPFAKPVNTKAVGTELFLRGGELVSGCQLWSVVVRDSMCSNLSRWWNVWRLSFMVVCEKDMAINIA